MELFKDAFSKSKDEKKVICIYLNGEDTDFWCGYIIDYNEDIVVLRHYTKYGIPDGIILEKIVNIECIKYDNEYCRLMAQLIADPSVLDFKDGWRLPMNKLANWQHDTLELLLNKADRIARIEIDKDLIYCGLVKWLDQDIVIITELNGHGGEEGTVLLKVEDITEIRINDLDCRRRLVFHRWTH